MLGREWGVRSVGQRKYRSPLYYPDTLVNPDTCLGNLNSECQAVSDEIIRFNAFKTTLNKCVNISSRNI